MTKIVGILNITPDSFSDGGKFNTVENALSQTKKLIEDGADMIDIGAESTRPGAKALTPEQEMLRVQDILPEIIAFVKGYNAKNLTNIETAIDSYHFETIKFAFECGVDVINDVTGLRDDRVVEFVAQNGIKTVLMHNLEIEYDKTIVINNDLGAAGKVYFWAARKIAELQKKGVKKSQLIFDPGIGFGKNAQQNINILKNIAVFHDLGVPIYVGHSKKRFLSEIFKKSDDKVMKTAAVSDFLVKRGVDYIRLHDIVTSCHFVT